MRKFTPAPPAVLAAATVRLLALAALGLLLFAGGSRAGAATPADSIAITSPNNTTIAESDDYATQVLGRPWDMSNGDPLLLLSHLTPPVVSNGIWSTQSTDQGASIFLQFQGFQGTFDYLGERNGPNYPIDTHRFSHLRFRMYSSVADRVVAWWWPVRASLPAGNSNFFATQPGWHVYDVDLAAPGNGGQAWTSQPTWAGLRLDPIAYMGHSGATIQFDWIRLTPPTGPAVSIAWTASGSSPVNLFLTTSPNGANELPIVANLPATSRSYSWTTAGLAPGTYYIHAIMGSTSSYSGPLVVNQAPVFDLTAPGPSSGEDFATTVLGSPWTMTGLSQLQAWYNLANIGFGPGYMQATGYIVGGGSADPQLWFLSYDMAHQIDTHRYHYVSYKLYLQAPPNPIGGQYSQANLGPRIIWSPPGGGWQQTTSYEAWYNRWLAVAHDLRTTPLEPGSNVGWAGTVPTFRLDPHEEDGALGSGITPPFFQLRELRLTADPTVQNGGKTTISWTSSKAGGTITLYYNTNRAVGGTAIATVPLSSGGYVWTVNGLPNGNYWVSATAQDGLNAFNQIALTPLTVSGNRSCPATFADLNPPYTQYVSDLYCRTVVEGYSDNTFRPYAAATRGALAQWVVRARGWALTTAGSPHFADVPDTDPLFPYIETAFNHGVVVGYGDGTFRPYDLVTRSQASKMIVNALGWGINTSGGPHFADVPPSNPFYAQIETAYNRGIISGYGDGTFRWGNPLLRGQLAKMLDLSLGQ